MELKKVKLDEIELYLNELDNDRDLRNMTYLEIATLIQLNFGVYCSEQQVNLLYDPKLEDIIDDMEAHYRVLGMIDSIDKEIYNE